VALELNSLSKTFNMAGWRVGMVLGNAKAIDAILKVKSNMDSGMFSFKRSNCCAEIYKKTPRFDGAVS
jgi:aspartate/methionine/tyrosine aminotransferase